MRLLIKNPLILFEKTAFILLILLLPTQFGKHFWPEFAVVNGLRIDYLSPTIYTTDLLIVSLFIVWVIRNTNHKQLSLKKFLFPFPLLLFILFLLINIFVSGNIYNGFYHWVKFVEYALLFFYIKASVPKIMSLQQITSLLAVGVVFESIVAILQYNIQSSIGGLFYFFGERSFTASTPGIANASLNGELVMRAYGTFPHPNVLAGFLVVSMFLIFFYLYPVTRKSLRILAVSSLLLGSAALLLTLSRIAILIWVGFIVIVFMRQVINKALVLGKLRVFSYSFIAVVSILLITQIVAPRFLTTSVTEESFVERNLLAQAALTMVVKRPVEGVGLGNFLPSLYEAQSPLLMHLHLQPVHNLFLLIGAEIGIVGLGFMFVFLGKTFKRMFHKKQLLTHIPILVCFSVILVTGSMDHYWITLQQGQLLFTFILGLSWTNLSMTLHLGKAKNIGT